MIKVIQCIRCTGWYNVGTIHECVLGQSYPDCREHRETQHRDNQKPWCNRCGWNRGTMAVPAEKLGRANGGWGTPSGTTH